MSDEEDRSLDRVIREESRNLDEPMEVDLHEDRTQEFDRVGPSRMRTDWRPEDLEALEGLEAVVEREMLAHFAGAYQIMNEIFEIVREPHLLTGGEIATDNYGFTIWARTDFGDFVEDYTKLSRKDLEHFLFKISVRLFEWEQAAVKLRSRSSFARALYERAMAQGYQDSRTQGGKTVEDRTQAGRLASQDPRLFGIFQTSMSWQADAIVRSAQLIGQRLKDVLSA